VICYNCANFKIEKYGLFLVKTVEMLFSYQILEVFGMQALQG
jgi:hypothetical protein